MVALTVAQQRENFSIHHNVSQGEGCEKTHILATVCQTFKVVMAVYRFFQALLRIVVNATSSAATNRTGWAHAD